MKESYKKTLKSTLITLGIFLVIGIIAYFLYNYYVFKTIVICIHDRNPQELGLLCSSDQECLDVFSKESAAMTEDESIPVFLRDAAKEMFIKSIYCETSCKMRRTYGNAFGHEQKNIQNCQKGEQEIKIEIKGKQGIELIKFIKNNPDVLQGFSI